ncbi:hypothetical protein K0M31_010418 [Melipona bicolor]|uniref:Uncharacterized protein n=1 Tax=Melipona bicolor TaxID=60889 RepID=A0AA40KIQ9_9HYME|nr:hypothetical protein K0M31_010418 [Melipona bicolor]
MSTSSFPSQNRLDPAYYYRGTSPGLIQFFPNDTSCSGAGVNFVRALLVSSGFQKHRVLSSTTIFVASSREKPSVERDDKKRERKSGERKGVGGGRCEDESYWQTISYKKSSRADSWHAEALVLIHPPGCFDSAVVSLPRPNLPPVLASSPFFLSIPLS